MKTPFCTILLVEDDSNDQLLFQIAFKGLAAQASLQIVPNGAEALRYLKGEGEYADRSRHRFPTMVITDLKMPLLDGFELLENIRSCKHWLVVPLIVLSSSTESSDIRKAYALGAHSYFAKPASHQALCDLLLRLCAYWTEVEVPEVDANGALIPTPNRNNPAAAGREIRLSR